MIRMTNLQGVQPRQNSLNGFMMQRPAQAKYLPMSEGF